MDSQNVIACGGCRAQKQYLNSLPTLLCALELQADAALRVGVELSIEGREGLPAPK